MKKAVILLLAGMLAACNAAVTGEDSKVRKEAQQVRQADVKQVTIVYGSMEEKNIVIDQQKIQIIMKELEGAVEQDAMFTLPAPEYIVTIVKDDGSKEIYHMWLTGEDRKGWMVKADEDNRLYVLSKESVEALLDIFPVPKPQGSKPLQQVKKADMRITRFLIQSKGQDVQYTISYKLSDALYGQLEGKAYYVQLTFPEKIQRMLGMKESGLVSGEAVKHGYKQYEITIPIPAPELSASQLQAIEGYYDGYGLNVYDENKKQVGRFGDLIMLVKEYGAQMDRLP